MDLCVVRRRLLEGPEISRIYEDIMDLNFTATFVPCLGFN